MQNWVLKISSKVGYRWLAGCIILIISCAMYMFLYGAIQSDHYDVELFQLSDETIRSAKTVVDPVKTEQERQRVAEDMEPSYQFNDTISANQVAVIDSLFGYISDAPQEASDEKATMAEMLEALKENLRLMETSGNGLHLTDDLLRGLLALSEKELAALKRNLENIVSAQLEQPIQAEELEAARDRIEQQIREDEQIPATVLQAAITIGRFAIIPTETINKELTSAQVEQAKASVEPTRILQGQVLVQEGQVVDREIYRQLELAGMIEGTPDYKPAFGLVLFVFISAGLLWIILERWNAKEVEKITSLLVILVILTVSLTLMKLLATVSGNFELIIAFLFPTALAGMIVRMLLNERLAVYITFLTGAIGGIMLQEGSVVSLQMEFALYIWFGGLAGVYLIEQDDHRVRLLQTSLAVGVVNAMFIGFYLLIGQSQYSMTEISFYFGGAIVSGILSGAMAIGLMPFFESAFGMLSTMKLIELSNPNHPLIKKILTETPGTYHHSIMVANLADASCEAIGANGLLARVACYYHDIGKTVRPQFFIENQGNMKNPHDSLPPTTSRDIILAHGLDGEGILRKHKLPKEISDIAAQHHGTSLLKYFYYKEKELDPEVAEANFRYAGPKPQTRETAIIMVADSIEAAVRSMKEPTSEKIKKLVDLIVEDKLKDGQFDECDLTMKELKTVKQIMCETLNGIFHSRIEYPKA